MASYSDLLKALRAEEYNLKRRIERIEKRGLKVPFDYQRYELDKTKDETRIEWEIEQKLDELIYEINRKSYVDYAEEYTKNLRERFKQEQLLNEEISKVSSAVYNMFYKEMGYKATRKLYKYEDVNAVVSQAVKEGLSMETILNNIDRYLELHNQEGDEWSLHFRKDSNGKWY